MPVHATSISVKKLTAAVNTAIGAAERKFPKVNLKPVQEVCYLPYWICGIPVPDPIWQTLQGESFKTVEAVAAEIGNSLGQQMPELFAGEAVGAAPVAHAALYSVNGHLIMGRRPAPQASLNIHE